VIGVWVRDIHGMTALPISNPKRSEARNSAVTDRRPTAWSFVQVGVWCRVLTLDYQLQFRVMTQRHSVTVYPVKLRHVLHKRSLRVTVILTLRLTTVGVGVSFYVILGRTRFWIFHSGLQRFLYGLLRYTRHCHDVSMLYNSGTRPFRWSALLPMLHKVIWLE
jgi:hypothetical protein